VVIALLALQVYVDVYVCVSCVLFGLQSYVYCCCACVSE
jgi:hypothetical protein